MESPYEIDRLLGMNTYMTSTPGIGGRLRETMEDFVVDEITRDFPEDSAGEYTHFTLEKRDWDTLRAIKTMARALRVSHKRFGFAGTKDKRAVTRQRVSVWRVGPEELEKVRIKDIVLSDFKKSIERINLGYAGGNRFRITVRDVEGDDIGERLEETKRQLDDKGVPNFFGYQWFGVIRPNTHLVGKKILGGDLEGAVMEYVGHPYEEEREDAYSARKMVEETRDYRKALEVFPRRLGYERSMLDALAKNPKDYAGALRRLPKKLRWMLVHAYQSYVFNRTLSRMIEEEVEIKGMEIPLVGWESRLEGRPGDIINGVLEEEGIKIADFKTPSMPELASAGGFRPAALETAVDYGMEEDELHPGKKKCVVCFDLQPGSYATVVLREFMKADPRDY
jgi:tRNA pseudouridine13 synthase